MSSRDKEKTHKWTGHFSHTYRHAHPAPPSAVILFSVWKGHCVFWLRDRVWVGLGVIISLGLAQ